MMTITPDTVLQLAQSTPALSEDQMRRIRDVVHFMSESDLKNLHEMLLQMQELGQADLQHEYDVRKNVAAKFREYQTDQARHAREGEEASTREEEGAAAEMLLKKI